MAQVVYPFNPQNGDDADVSLIDSNFQTVAVQVNGNLEAGVNVRTGAPTVQDSTSGLSEGSANTLMRSDAQFILRGFEQLAADPATNNKVGREYFNTATLQKRLCIDPTGTGTWITTGNLAATDLPNHSSRHAVGGPDALPNNSVAGSMLGRSGFIAGTCSASTVTIQSGTWTDIITGVTVTASGTSGQAALFAVNVGLNVTNSNAPTIHFRVQDDTPTSVWRTTGHNMGANGTSNQTKVLAFPFLVNVVGTKIYKLQAVADATGCNVTRDATSVVGETGTATLMQVLVG